MLLFQHKNLLPLILTAATFFADSVLNSQLNETLNFANTTINKPLLRAYGGFK
jgi:hypothetical protein